MNELQNYVKLKLSFDGWHCLSKKQTQDVLKRARGIFHNANFVDGVGLLIEDSNEINIVKFCLEIISLYKIDFANWDGYEIKRISKKILINFADRKRKLSKEYFVKLIKENELHEVLTVIAGMLYLSPDEVSEVINTAENDFDKPYKMMEENELNDLYRILIMYASSKERSFSINR
jgi:hypothetical protein